MLTGKLSAHTDTFVLLCDLCFDDVEIVISEKVLKIMYIKEEVLQRYTYTI